MSNKLLYSITILQSTLSKYHFFSNSFFPIYCLQSKLTKESCKPHIGVWFLQNHRRKTSIISVVDWFCNLSPSPIPSTWSIGLAGGKTHIVLKKTPIDLKTYRPISSCVNADWFCQPSPACKPQIGFADHILIFHDFITFCFCFLVSFPAVCDFKYKINSCVQIEWSKQLVSFFFILYSLFAYFF